MTPDLSPLTAEHIAADLAEIAASFRIWETSGRLLVPACLEAQLGRHVALTPRAWREALTQRRQLLEWERQRRAAAG